MLSFAQTEGDLKSKDDEELTYRIYSDGWVKIEGYNMREEFATIDETNEFIKNNGITK